MVELEIRPLEKQGKSFQKIQEHKYYVFLYATQMWWGIACKLDIKFKIRRTSHRDRYSWGCLCGRMFCLPHPSWCHARSTHVGIPHQGFMGETEAKWVGKLLCGHHAGSVRPCPGPSWWPWRLSNPREGQKVAVAFGPWDVQAGEPRQVPSSETPGVTGGCLDVPWAPPSVPLCNGRWGDPHPCTGENSSQKTKFNQSWPSFQN